ncbi:MAG: DEAD/DEAH box helicase [Candidatus Omnitrophica bacterium]|nr:DEAD/DEAH box helicase [Candidatus Omnitrophota bacterium]
MFKFDKFQQQAIDHINNGFSVVVAAPTGAGKTVIAEHVIEDCIAKKTRVIYTSPIKALSNQKYRDFCESYGDMVGIVTGDVSINAHAPVLIMTTEIFRNKILGEEASLEEYSWVIFDEIHYLDNYERGTVWEESLIFMPGHMKILALSATIPNIDQFVDWIHSIHEKELKIVKEEHRPVPLHFYFQYENRVIDNIKKIKAHGHRHKRHYYHKGRKHPAPRKRGAKPNKLPSLVRHLEERDRFPCIYFVFGRKRCEQLAEKSLKFDFLNDTEQAGILKVFDDLCARYDLLEESRTYDMRALVAKGIAYHHAGMLPTLKEVVERLFTSRLIKMIFTTETFALGINMPARTVVFDELRKFYGRFFANIKTRDFYQMAGRAGRRGIDEEGFVYSRVNPQRISSVELKKIIFGSPERVRSRFNASYATLLNLYDRYGEDLYAIYPRSFHYFQEKPRRREKAVELLEAKVNLLKTLRYIENGELSQKGVFASNVYGYELSLSELYERGVLEGLDHIQLAVLCAALVFEPRKDSKCPRLNKTARRLRHITDEVTGYIHDIEIHNGVKEMSKKYYYHLSPAIEAWMTGAEFDDILKLTDVDEGEIIRYFRMSIQILREILDTPAPDQVKNTTRKAIGLINREIVDAEKQLREA